MNSTAQKILFLAVIAGIFAVLWQTVGSTRNQPKVPEISYSDFLGGVEDGRVSKVTIYRNQAQGRYRDGSSFRVTVPASQEGMLRTLHDAKVEIWVKDAPSGDWPSWFTNLAPVALIAAIWLFLMRQARARSSSTPGGSGSLETMNR